MNYILYLNFKQRWEGSTKSIKKNSVSHTLTSRLTYHLSETKVTCHQGIKVFFFLPHQHYIIYMLAFRIYEYTSEYKFKIPDLKGIYLLAWYSPPPILLRNSKKHFQFKCLLRLLFFFFHYFNLIK